MEFVEPSQGDILLGAFRVVSGIKGVTVLIHAPVGCHWGVNFIERLSGINTNSTISALRERNVIFGGEDNLRKAVEIILKRRKRGYIVLLIGSVPSIIGEDVEGVVSSVGSNFHYISLDCGGFRGKMWEGYEDCLVKLSKWMEPSSFRKKNRPLANLIGFQQDVVRAQANENEIRRVLSMAGVELNAVLPPRSINELKRAARADLNVVLGYGIRLAKEMERKLGIPYHFFNLHPYGLSGTEEFISAICEKLGLDDVNRKLQREKDRTLELLKKAHLYLPSLHGVPVAISADSPSALGISRFLSRELGMKIELVHITSSSHDGVCGLKDICKDIFEEDSWDKFVNLLNKKEVKLIFGTDLERVISQKKNIPFLPFSYPTISRIALTSSPYLGFRGVLTLVEEMVNLALDHKL